MSLIKLWINLSTECVWRRGRRKTWYFSSLGVFPASSWIWRLGAGQTIFPIVISLLTSHMLSLSPFPPPFSSPMPRLDIFQLLMLIKLEPSFPGLPCPYTTQQPQICSIPIPWPPQPLLHTLSHSFTPFLGSWRWAAGERTFYHY